MIRLAVQRRLERGVAGGVLADAGAALWERWSNPVRPVARLPAAAVIGIGGATLGGGYKTPATLELARVLSRHLGRMAVVAGGYAARCRRPRVVSASDDVRLVGDEALYLSRQVAGENVCVVVGPNRQQALDLAASRACVVLVDALLQARPRRLTRSILVLDASAPWGSGRCPPAGDLRAARARLLRAADLILTCRDRRATSPIGETGVPSFEAILDLAGAIGPAGEHISIESLRGARLGVVLAIARPGRVTDTLARYGIAPVAVEIWPDHGTPRERGRVGPRIDAWLTTGKCATKLGQCHAGAPVWQMDHRLALPPALVPLLIHAIRSDPW